MPWCPPPPRPAFPSTKLFHSSCGALCCPPLGDVLLVVTGLQVLLEFSGSETFLLHFHRPPPPFCPTCQGHWLPRGSHQAPFPSLAQPAAEAWSLGRLSVRAQAPETECQTAAPREEECSQGTASPGNGQRHHCQGRPFPQERKLLFSSRSGVLNLGTMDVLGEIILFGGAGRPVHCGICSSSPGLYLPDASTPQL